MSGDEGRERPSLKSDLPGRPGHGHAGSLSRPAGGAGAPVALSLAQAMDILRGAMIDSVRTPGMPDLTARQMAVLLLVYRDQAPPTVRGLAAALDIPKPAVTRALDRLSGLGFVRRKIDEADRRNVLVQRTVTGSVYLDDFTALIIEAARRSGEVSPTAVRDREGRIVGDGIRPTDVAWEGASDGE